MASPSGSATSIRVLLVDDHPIVRRGLVELLNEAPDLHVCGEAASAAEALAFLAGHGGNTQPDIAIVDLTLRDDDGLTLVATIARTYPDVRVLVLSGHDERLYADRSLRAGALGYVMKDQAATELLDATRRVAGGKPYASEAAAERVLAAMSGPARANQPAVDRLTDRELHVLTLIGRGMSTRDIATQLSLSVKTVESHYAHIKEKLCLQTGRDLTRVAVTWVEFGAV